MLALIEAAEQASLDRQSNPVPPLADDEREDPARAFLHALRSATTAEVAFVHLAAFPRSPLPANPTEADLRRAFPFPDRVARLTLTGTQLAGLWRRRRESFSQGLGLGFVGLAEERDGGRLLVNGRPLREADRYRVATVEYLAKAGFSLLPPQPKAILPERVADLLVRQFATVPVDRRQARIRHLDRRGVVRQKLFFSGTYNQLQFGGSAPSLQYKDPKAAYTGSDVPGLMGSRHLRRGIELSYEGSIDRRDADTLLRARTVFVELEPVKLQDQWTLLLRHQRKSLEPGLFPFVEVQMTGSNHSPAVAGRRKPFFGKGVAGMAWKRDEALQVFVGLGGLKRWSMPGQPSDTGLNVGYEYSDTLARGVKILSRLDVFAGHQGDRVRMYDGLVQIEAPLFGRLSAVVRETLFGWRDATIGSFARRRETFSGLGYTLDLRHF